VIALLDGDRGRNALDLIGLRLVHALQELARVRTEGFDVAALAFRVDSVESEAGFSAAAGTRENDELPERKIEVDALKIILPRAADADDSWLRHCQYTFRPGRKNAVS